METDAVLHPRNHIRDIFNRHPDCVRFIAGIKRGPGQGDDGRRYVLGDQLHRPFDSEREAPGGRGPHHMHLFRYSFGDILLISFAT